MFIDKKGKLFGKISIVDICVLLVVVIGILGVVFTIKNLNSGKLDGNVNISLNSGDSSEIAEIGLLLKEVRDVTKDAIIIGDDVYTTKDNKLIGTIKSIDSKPSERNVTPGDGNVYKNIIPERYDVTIFVEAKGKKTDTGFFTESGEQILYNDALEIKTTTIKTTPIVCSMKLK